MVPPALSFSTHIMKSGGFMGALVHQLGGQFALHMARVAGEALAALEWVTCISRLACDCPVAYEEHYCTTAEALCMLVLPKKPLHLRDGQFRRHAVCSGGPQDSAKGFVCI